MRRLPFFLQVLGSFALSLGVGACAADASEGLGAQSPALQESRSSALAGTRLRVVAANLTSGNQQSYDPGDGSRILKGLAPDVALVQEMNFGSNTPDDYKTFVTVSFGEGYTYTVEPDVQIPNGVVSRFPILEAGAWADPRVANRSFVWARIDVPGDKDLWAVSLHLLTTGTANRQAEATALVGHLREVVPESDYLVLGGDLNTGSRSESCLQTLGQLGRTQAPWPADASGKGGTNRSRAKPLDWVIADPDLDALAAPVAIGGMNFPNGLVFDSRNYPRIVDVVPVRTTDSAATNMQHMAVVRDFVLPN